MEDTIEDARITVNGVGITQSQINGEVQYHASDSLKNAKQMAMQALVVRELLLQEAGNQNICVKTEDEAIDELLEKEIKVPKPDVDTCHRYYEQNRKRFHTSPLFEVSHILFLALQDDVEARDKAREQAEKTILEIKENPKLFSVLAKRYSACPSSINGGRMGQVSKGQTAPEFEAALFHMKKGDISEEPVETKFGFHIVKVHERMDGEPLPFEAMAKWIEDYLEQNAWQTAVSQYIQILAGKADIDGFTLKSVDSPIVQ